MKINNDLQMYENIAKVHGISREKTIISLKRPEWQQPANVFPPLHKRLTGQRRRRILGAFPETENDVDIFRFFRFHLSYLFSKECRLENFASTIIRTIRSN